MSSPPKVVIVVLVNGVEYTGFNSISVSRSITRLVNFASIEASTDAIDRFPIKVGDAIQVQINKKNILTGYIDVISINYSSGSGNTTHAVRLEAYDRTIDIEQSTLDNTITLNAPISLVQIIQKILTYLELADIKIINKAGSAIDAYAKDYIVSAEVGGKAIDFINKYSNMREVLVITDGDGNINLIRTPEEAPTAKISNVVPRGKDAGGNVNNIKTCTMSFDNTERFNSYRVFSQAASSDIFKKGTAAAAGSTTSSIVIDDGIRKSRKMVILAESSDDAHKCKKRANWEKNVRIAPSRNYVIEVYSFVRNDKGEIWEPNILVDVKDDFANITSELLLESVNYEWSLSNGSVCTLTFINKFAISTQLQINRATEEANLEGKSVNSIFK